MKLNDEIRGRMSAMLPRNARTVPGLPLSPGWGLLLALGAALISGLSIYLNAFAVKQLPDAALFTTLKNGVAALVLVGAALGMGAVGELRTIERRRWPLLIAVGVVGGSVPFVLFFSGLAQASAPSAAFIQKTLFLWVALLAVPFLGERLGPVPLVAVVVLLLGQALVMPPEGIVWGAGEAMILAATGLWAVEVVLAKRLLGGVSSGLLGAVRMGVGVVVLTGYLILSGKAGLVGSLTPAQLLWVLLTGLLLAGYVATWLAALKRAPASSVSSVLVVGAVITGILTAVSKGAAPSVPTVGGYILIVAAACAIVVWTRRAAIVVEGSVGPGARRARVA
jgi:drug/metabolite transporter (DMT)-like permease